MMPHAGLYSIVLYSTAGCPGVYSDVLRCAEALVRSQPRGVDLLHAGLLHGFCDTLSCTVAH